MPTIFSNVNTIIPTALTLLTIRLSNGEFGGGELWADSGCDIIGFFKLDL
jgi:hypothetical protein